MAKIINRFKIHFILFFGSVLLSVLILETLLQVYDKVTFNNTYGLNPLQTTLRWEFDPLHGNMLVPQQVGWFIAPSKEYATKLSINSQGWYNTEYSKFKNNETFRIIIVGDSFTESFQVSMENTYFKQLENKLFQDGYTNIEVYTFGMGDTGTAQQLVLLQKLIPEYKPDLIIQLFLTSNDVYNNTPKRANKEKPYFELDKENTLHLVKPIDPREEQFYTLKKHLKKSKLVTLALRTKQRIIERRNGYSDLLEIYKVDYSKEIEDAWEITKKLLYESEHLAKINNSKYILISLVNNEQVHEDVWNSFLENSSIINLDLYDKDKPDKVLQTLCNQISIDCYFMAPYFNSYRQENSDERTHFTKDGHWNYKGNELAAEYIYSVLTNTSNSYLDK